MPIDAQIPLMVRPPEQGPNPLDSLAKVLQIKQAQQMMPLQIQEAQQRQQESSLKLQEFQRQISDRAALNKAYADAVAVDPETGAPRFDRDKLTQALASGGHADQISTVMESLDKADKSRADLREAQQKVDAGNAEYGASIGAATKAAGYDPGFFRAKLAVGIGNKAINPQTIAPILQELQQADQQDPTGEASKAVVRKYSDALIAQSEKMVTAQSRATTAATGAARFAAEGPKIAADTQIAQQKAAGTEPIQPVDQARMDFQQKQLDRELNANLETARHNRVDEGEAARYHNLSVEGVALTPEAKLKMAEMFASTGVLPNLGMGKAAAQNRSDIINMAAEKFPQVDFASNKAAFQANTASLKSLQTTSDKVDSFEQTAGKNIDLFLKTAGKIVDTGSPLLNKPARMISETIFGSSNMAAFKAARETALTEAAKVLESPGGNQALTVSGRESVKVLSDPNATLGQQVNAMKILRQDMANRKQSNADTIEAIKQRISQANPNAPPPAAAAPAAAHRIKIGSKLYDYKGTGDTADLKNYTEVK